MSVYLEQYDLVRGVMVSLGSLLFGMLVFGTLQAWRQRMLPVPPKRAPFPVIGGFSLSYAALLVLVIVERWSRIGEPLTVLSWIAMGTLIANVLTLAMMVHYTKSVELTPWEFRRALKKLYHLNVRNWRRTHPGNGSAPPVMTRYQDQLAAMSDEELERAVNDKPEDVP